MNNNGDKPAPLQGGVILGQKKWRCKEGHEWRGPMPTVWQFSIPVGTPVAGQQQMLFLQSGALCLICLLDWAAKVFPLMEVQDAPK